MARFCTAVRFHEVTRRVAGLHTGQEQRDHHAAERDDVESTGHIRVLLCGGAPFAHSLFALGDLARSPARDERSG